ncbi:MAG: tetratricopeptide repeat protein [Hyphomicrobiaceae bacterium]|nr:tetratricopeptide repeat protein [Hyphomicrobiaceae bacterium]
MARRANLSSVVVAATIIAVAGSCWLAEAPRAAEREGGAPGAQSPVEGVPPHLLRKPAPLTEPDGANRRSAPNAAPDAGAETGRESGANGDLAPKGEALPDDDSKSVDAKAEDKPQTPSQRRRALDDLYAYLAATENAGTAAPLVAAIERLWLFSGSDTIDVLMERVLKAVAEQNLDLAEKLADTIVDLEPGFAEGWNRRALVAFLRDDKENALNALRRALALEPNHFKALDGMAQILRDQGDKVSALKTYEKLLEIDPFWEGAQEAVDQLKREVEGEGI